MARVSPERRRPIDLVVTAVIIAVVIAVGVTVWAISPVRHTENVPAAGPVPAVKPATNVPAALVTRWQAPSDATVTPAIAGSVVVTGDGGAIAGRDPATGRVLWSYERAQSLCAIKAAWPASSDLVLAVYRNSRGCSEVTALDAKSGVRRATRTSDADPELRLVSDSGYVLALGPRRLETWGSNLVRGIEYGRIEARTHPDAQPDRADCRLLSGGIAGDRIAIIEHCGDEPGYRLTVLGAVLDSDERVTQYGSSIITSGTAGPPPVLVTMTTSAIAVYDGGVNSAEPTPPSIRLFDSDGVQGRKFDVKGPTAPPADSRAVVGPRLTTYFTGTSTLVFDHHTAQPIYEVPDTIGPGDEMADRLLLPTRRGISVRTMTDLREVSVIPIDRSKSVAGQVSLRVLGDTVVEQQGADLTAYTAPPAR